MSNRSKLGSKTGAPTVQVTFQVVGPLLRQIIDEGPRPAREVALEHLSVWATATRLHLFRFKRSFTVELKLFSNRGPIGKFASQRVRIDEHMLLASAANLEKALRRFGHELPGVSVPKQFLELLRLMRNVYEHWEDYMPHVVASFPDAGSGKKLKELAPSVQPWAIEWWPGQDIKLARVLSLRELDNHLRALRGQLAKLGA
jgi:hypothetical protein